MDSHELKQLLAASQDVSCAPKLLPRLPQVGAHAAQLLELGRTETGAHVVEDVLLCFRILRNVAAAGPVTCEALLRLGLLDLIRTALELVATATIALDWHLPAVVSQALANLCNGSTCGAAAAWAALFPLHYNILAHVNAGASQEATCLALLSCCKTVPGAAACLAGPQGSEVMTALLCNPHKRQQNNDLGLLVANLCFAHDLLPSLFQAVGQAPPTSVCNPANDGSTLLRPTAAQVALLEALCAEAHDMPEAAWDDGGQRGATAAAAGSMRFLVQLAEKLAALSCKPPALHEGQQQLLQDALHLMRDICARDDSGCMLAEGGDLVAALQVAGFLPSLLSMLKALGPIQTPQRRPATPATVPGNAPASSIGFEVAELAPMLTQRAQHFPTAQPYSGFRTDLLAAVANAAHGRPRVQAEVCCLGGVELVLAQCQLDQHSPLAREWALWGVRNLCDGNAEAQEAIRELKLCTTVDTEELQRLGVRLELDELSGKLRVSKRMDGMEGGSGG